jgi:CRP-like cAMP-binding protein
MVVQLLGDAYDPSHMANHKTTASALLNRATPDPAAAFGVLPKQRRAVAGDLLFRQGSPTLGVFKLVSGRVRLIRTTAGGAQATMHTARPGELFAEASLFSTHYHCDAEALEPSQLLLYPKAALMRSLRETPELLWSFTAELTRRVQGLRTRIEVQRTRSARERVLQFLQLHCDSKGLWLQQGTLKQLADELALTHEALYRTLAELERDRRIIRSERGILLGPGV